MFSLPFYQSATDLFLQQEDEWNLTASKAERFFFMNVIETSIQNCERYSLFLLFFHCTGKEAFT